MRLLTISKVPLVLSNVPLMVPGSTMSLPPRFSMNRAE